MSTVPPFYAANAATGLFPKKVMDSLRSAFGITTTRLATFGDSMTAYAQGGYAPYGALVAEYLGLSLFNPSVPGEATSDIALRQGGFAAKFKVPGGVIPADTSSFPVNLVDPVTSGFIAGTTPGNIGTFKDMTFLGISVTLYHLNGAWTMARTTADVAQVAVPSAGAWARSITSAAWRNAIQVYMGGYNGGDQVQAVTMMRSFLTNPDAFVALAKATGPSGANPAGYEAHNAALQAAFPDQFFGMTDYVIANGLADEGITPTAQDTVDIAARIVPTSLRRSSSDPHYNAAGHRVIARRLAELLLARGLVAPNDAQHIPPRGMVTPPIETGLILSLPSTTSTASVSTNSALQTADSLSVRLINVTIPSVTDSAAYRALVSRPTGTSFQLLLTYEGKLFFQDPNGAVASGASAGIAPAGGKISIRADVNRAAGTQSLYTSTDAGVTWVLYGTAKTGRSSTYPIGGLAGPLVLGANGTYPAVPGSKVERLVVLDGSGVVLEDHNFTITDSEGWTYAGGAAIVSA